MPRQGPELAPAGPALAQQTVRETLRNVKQQTMQMIEKPVKAGRVSERQIQKGAVKLVKVEYGEQYTREKRKKVLKPDIEYTSKEGYTYTTDSKGRIASCEGGLQLGDGKRNNYAQRVVGRDDRLSDDDGGHLIASIFKGSGDIDNLVPMNSNLNRGEWTKTGDRMV